MTSLVEPWSPEKIVHVDCLRIDPNFLFDFFVADPIKRWYILKFGLAEASEPCEGVWHTNCSLWYA